MTTTPAPPGRHHVLATLAGLREQVGALADASLVALSAGEAGEALVEATRLVAQAEALTLRVAEHARRSGVETADGSTSAAVWWAGATRSTRTETHRRLRLAAALEAHPAVAEALARGRLLPEQAGVVVAAVDALPREVGLEVRARAEAELLRYAAEFDAAALRRLGRSILTTVAPEVGEAHDAAELEREEREAAASARLVMTDDGHGRTHGRFVLPTVQAAMLRALVRAYAAPRHRAATDGPLDPADRALLGPEKLGRAFGELIESLPQGTSVPEAGGTSATVVVTMSLDSLLGGLAAATLDTGEALSASRARMLACGAGLVPAVLGTGSVPLDLGRKTRLHTPTQRIALGLRDGGCTAEGCDWPPGMCQAHHDLPWYLGGGTSVAAGRLLCPFHHARAHDTAYEMVHLPGGKVAFHRRT